MNDHERRVAAGLVLSGDVNGDLPFVVDVVRFDDQRLRVFRIDFAEDLASDAWVEEFGFLRIDNELFHLGNHPPID